MLRQVGRQGAAIAAAAAAAAAAASPSSPLEPAEAKAAFMSPPPNADEWQMVKSDDAVDEDEKAEYDGERSLMVVRPPAQPEWSTQNPFPNVLLDEAGVSRKAVMEVAAELINHLGDNEALMGTIRHKLLASRADDNSDNSSEQLNLDEMLDAVLLEEQDVSEAFAEEPAAGEDDEVPSWFSSMCASIFSRIGTSAKKVLDMVDKLGKFVLKLLKLSDDDDDGKAAKATAVDRITGMVVIVAVVELALQAIGSTALRSAALAILP